MTASIINFIRRDHKRSRHRIAAEKAQMRILRGMAREMSPTQAIVFMSYFHQFPERRGRDDYFQPDTAAVIKQLKISPWTLRKLTANLVTAGFLEKRRRGMFGAAYKIMFEKLEKYAGGGE